MAILNILHFPDERLRIRATPVANIDNGIREIVRDMFETMYDAPGVGLAATQIDVHQQIIVIDVSEEKDAPHCLINPEIIDSSGEDEMEEGCLSVPGIYEMVKRYSHVRVRASNESGEEFELEADDLLAVCIQHEIDHLQGKLFVDYLSELKRQRIRKKLEKQRRLTL